MGRIDDLLTLEAAGELPKNMQTDLDTLRSAGEAPPKIGAQPADLTKTAEPTQPKTYGQALQSGLESIIPGAIAGVKQIASDIPTFLKGPSGGMQAGETPEQVIARTKEAAPGFFKNLLKGGASGATAGIYQPPAPTTEAEAAAQRLGQVGGFALPFTGVSKAAKAIPYVAPWAARLIAGGVTGAAGPLSRGDIPGAIEQGVSGAGQVGLTNAAITAATAPVKAITSTLANRSAAKAAGGAQGILRTVEGQQTGGVPVEQAGQAFQQAGKTAAKAAGSQMQEARTMVPPDVTVPSSASEVIRQALPEAGPLRTGTEAKLMKLANDLDPNGQYISPTEANADFRSKVLTALGQGISNRPTTQEVQGYLTRLTQSRNAPPPEEAQIVGRPATAPTPPLAPPPAAELPRINLTRTAEQQAAAAAPAQISAIGTRPALKLTGEDLVKAQDIWRENNPPPKIVQDADYYESIAPKNMSLEGWAKTQELPDGKTYWELIKEANPIRAAYEKQMKAAATPPPAASEPTIKMGESATAKVAAPTPPPVGASPQGQPAQDYLKTQAAAQEPLQPRGQMPVISPAQFRNKDFVSQAADKLAELQQPAPGLSPEANLGVSFQELIDKRQALNRLYGQTRNAADKHLLILAKNAVDADINKFRASHSAAVDKYYQGVADWRDKVVPLQEITQAADGTPEYPENVVKKFRAKSTTPINETVTALENSGPDGQAALQQIRNGVKTAYFEGATKHGEFDPKAFLRDVEGPDDIRKLKALLGPDEFAKLDNFRQQLLDVGADKWSEGPSRGGGMWVRMHLVRAAMGLGLGNMFTVASQGGTAGIMYFGPALFQKLANDSRGAKLIAAGMMAGNAPEGSATLNAIAALAKTLGGKEVKDLAAMGVAAENVQRNQQQQEAPTQLPPTSGAAFFPPIRRGAPVTAGGSTR